MRKTRRTKFSKTMFLQQVTLEFHDQCPMGTDQVTAIFGETSMHKISYMVATMNGIFRVSLMIQYRR